MQPPEDDTLSAQLQAATPHAEDLPFDDRFREVEARLEELEAALRQHTDAQVQQVVSEMRGSIQGLVRDEEARLAELAAELRASIKGLVADDEKRLGQAMHGIDERVNQATRGLHERIDQVVSDHRKSLEPLLTEQRERIQHVLDEQRVCMRQLALQNSEQAVLAERAQRATELRLDEMARQLAQLTGGRIQRDG